MTGMRTLLLGLDAACKPVLEPMFEAGDLPALSEVFEGGVADDLESQLPPWTPSAWPSIYTGVNPGKHGVYGFLEFDGYDYDVVNRTHVKEYALWETLSRHGFTSVVVNVPVTHPPREFDGALVPGYTAPEDPTCHPDGLLEEVRDAIGGYTVYGSDTDNPDSKEVDQYLELTRMRGEAFRYLCGEYDPDFGFLQFQQTDTVCHELPGDRDALRAVYRAVDEQVDLILDEYDPDNVVVVSDHGIGPYDGYEFRVNEYLRNTGFVAATQGGDGMPSWTSIARKRLKDGEEGDGSAADRTALERAMAAGAKVGLTAQRAHRVLDHLGVADVVARRVPTDAIRAATEQVDFPTSRAYVRSRIELGVRINLAGREPDGVVPEEEYEWVRGELISRLEDARTPDGEPVFDAVIPREEVYHGPYVEDAPDVVVVPASFDHHLSASLLGAEFAELDDHWSHKMNGVIAASGPDVDADASLAGAHVYDVAPTVLATFGVPRSDRGDGGPLPIVGDAGVEEPPEFERQDERATNDQTVEQHLSDLGYLE